jgi:polyadenylate-binding protein
MFQEFGEIESVHVQRDENGQLKNQGFVSFKDHADAEKALDAMNKKSLPDGSFLMVARHISKKENEILTPGSTIHPIS